MLDTDHGKARLHGVEWLGLSSLDNERGYLMAEALIAAVNQQFMEAISRSDAAGVAALYAEHG